MERDIYNNISPWDLHENLLTLSWLYERMLKAADFGGGMKQQIATLGYELYNLATMARCRFDTTGGNSPVVVMRFQTRKERERAFFLGHDKDMLIDCLRIYGQHRKDNGADDCRVVIPSPLFGESDLPVLLGSDWKLKNKPTSVWRAYADRQSFTEFSALPEGYSLKLIQPQDTDEISRLYDMNYPDHSFDQRRVSEGNYLGVAAPNGKWISACGMYAPFFVDGFGSVTVSSDLVVAKQERRNDLGIATYSAVIQRALTGSLFLPPSAIVIADCISERSVSLARRLGFREANQTWWTVYRRK